MDRSFLLLLLLLLLFLPHFCCSSAPFPSISLTCAGTRNPTHCTHMLEKLPAKDLLHISLNATLRHVSAALNGALSLSTSVMGGVPRAAYEDCIELLDDSVDLLSRSVGSIGGARDDVMTWLSAALTNHDTCTEGLEASGDGRLRQEMTGHLKDMDLLVSNCLAIFSSPGLSKDFTGVPIDNNRFPAWVNPVDRKLLWAAAAADIEADLVVSKGGENGTYGSVAEAVKAAPENSSRRFVIYIKAGRYDENVKVSRKKINLMFVGDGKGKTVIAGCRSIFDNITTFRTATFAATGAGLVIKDLTIENWAGPNKHQAVALRVGADHAVIYRCSIIGYQDTLYVHSQRQFFRECDIYGTVDFIFGNAAVVFQKCGIWARKPLPMQKITITAQNRKDPNQNTGISIHNCQIMPTPDLSALIANSSTSNASSSVQTFLGRPWKMYSRVVYLLSYMGGHVEPRGWLEWNQSFALDTLYYGEYLNSGPGSALGKRVQWPGYKVIKLPEEASKFTVANFIFGSSWLPSTGVAYLAGLSL